MPKIGPHFADELRAAGLAGLPFCWTPGLELPLERLISFDQAMTTEQRDAVLAVLAAHDATLPAAPAQRELDSADVRAKADALLADGTVPPRVKDFVAALKKVL